MLLWLYVIKFVLYNISALIMGTHCLLEICDQYTLLEINLFKINGLSSKSFCFSTYIPNIVFCEKKLFTNQDHRLYWEEC